jgi:hypothetical protein
MIPVKKEQPIGTAARDWLRRAATARSVAGSMSADNAAIAEAYARDCEAEARRLMSPAPQPLAA